MNGHTIEQMILEFVGVVSGRLTPGLRESEIKVDWSIRLLRKTTIVPFSVWNYSSVRLGTSYSERSDLSIGIPSIANQQLADSQNR
jgi:hypothetical protein